MALELNAQMVRDQLFLAKQGIASPEAARFLEAIEMVEYFGQEKINEKKQLVSTLEGLHNRIHGLYERLSAIIDGSGDKVSKSLAQYHAYSVNEIRKTQRMRAFEDELLDEFELLKTRQGISCNMNYQDIVQKTVYSAHDYVEFVRMAVTGFQAALMGDEKGRGLISKYDFVHHMPIYSKSSGAGDRMAYDAAEESRQKFRSTIAQIAWEISSYEKDAATALHEYDLVKHKLHGFPEEWISVGHGFIKLNSEAHNLLMANYSGLKNAKLDDILREGNSHWDPADLVELFF